MTAKESVTHLDWSDIDDAPDLTTPEWKAQFEAAPVVRGRPQSPTHKISTTIRLSQDVLFALKATGKGWQTRVEQTLRHSLGL
jgi:uncharacterized protein (DUF4415 family)